MDVELLSNSYKHEQTWISSAALNSAEIGQINLRAMSDLLLTEVSPQSQPTDVGPY